MKTVEPVDHLRLHETLAIVLGHAKSHFDQDDYCLVGTAAALLHGVALSAGDVDLLMRQRSHVDAFAMALSSFRVLTPPTLLEAAKQYYAAFDVNGVQVEASTVEVPTDSAYIETYGQGPWTYQTLIAVGPYRVPTVALELRLATELLRNRRDRYEPLIAWMRTNGCDVDLLNHSMKARGLSPEVHRATLAQFSGIASPTAPIA